MAYFCMILFCLCKFNYLMDYHHVLECTISPLNIHYPKKTSIKTKNIFSTHKPYLISINHQYQYANNHKIPHYVLLNQFDTVQRCMVNDQSPDSCTQNRSDEAKIPLKLPSGYTIAMKVRGEPMKDVSDVTIILCRIVKGKIRYGLKAGHLIVFWG